MLARSASTVSAGSGSARFSTGSDSPVSAASATRSSRTSSSRRSAGTLSPEASRTTSPGTSSRASMRWRCPPRSTVASVVSARASASSAPSALLSWTKPITALRKITPKITDASVYAPTASLMTVATSRMWTSTW